MITLEEARKCYPKGEAPPDDVLRKILVSFYRIAEMEWNEMMEEKANEKSKTNKS